MKTNEDLTPPTKHGWIGVDLDGTLAVYTEWRAPDHIGEPIPAMVERVCKWLAEGQEVRIMTARACVPEHIRFVQEWCLKHIGIVLTVTNAKDYQMRELWDDRAVRVKFNTGERCCNN